LGFLFCLNNILVIIR